MLIVLLIFLTFSIWIFRIYLLSNWKHVFKFAFLNFILVSLYYSIIIYGGKYIFGHDGYGLKAFFWLLFTLFCHVLLGFTFALYKSYTLKNEKQT